MKATLIFLGLLATITISVSGQEHDDMYFNSKDRAELRVGRAKNSEAYASVRNEETSRNLGEDEVVNPTDSYSARNVNPEFAARSNADVARSDNEDYFNSNYHYNTSSELNSWNNNFSSQYSNNWYHNSYWTPGMHSWNSPYYGNFYDPWSNIWYSPYSRSGWTSSFSFSYGNMWNGYNGWSMGYGYGNPYMMYNPYSYWYNPYSHWYNPYYGNGYVVVRERDRSPYGKRNSRNISNYDRGRNNGNGIGTRPSTTPDVNQRSESGSRMSSNTSRQGSRSNTTTRQPEYYDRSWRNQSTETTTTGSSFEPSSSPSRTRSSNSGSQPTRSSTWGSGSNSNSNSTPSYTPSRSSSGSSGGASRSSGGGGSSSGGSRGRGR